MVSRTDAAEPRLLMGVSCPGSLARQFRVQCQDHGGEVWRLYAAYTNRDEAEGCLHALLGDGVAARLIDYSFCSTAA